MQNIENVDTRYEQQCLLNRLKQHYAKTRIIALIGAYIRLAVVRRFQTNSEKNDRCKGIESLVHSGEAKIELLQA